MGRQFPMSRRPPARLRRSREFYHWQRSPPRLSASLCKRKWCAEVDRRRPEEPCGVKATGYRLRAATGKGSCAAAWWISNCNICLLPALLFAASGSRPHKLERKRKRRCASARAIWKSRAGRIEGEGTLPAVLEHLCLALDRKERTRGIAATRRSSWASMTGSFDRWAMCSASSSISKACRSSRPGHGSRTRRLHSH
ncbi:hypothetical protein SAMN04488498_15218 [Mesorhizobium albiziae]|uniref:Uncharacterized protein n=1 Tax=Neomesorhizobium albiziae TaxID=335020 RepID=A0A1I4FR12_9HYPH|nr:hypothetical protein SAMN04488498_15218 [Mesorhizobium albiziae]